MAETVTFKGQPVRLKGQLIKEGSPLPDCELVNEELKPFKLHSLKGKPLLLIAVPSLDTSVCSRESRRFSQEVEKYKNEINAVVVSMDLPFAQKRWCIAENIKNLKLLSDHKKRELGEKLGIYMEELGLLARTVLICDKDLNVKYVQLVREVTDEPDYQEVLNHLQKSILQVK